MLDSKCEKKNQDGDARLQVWLPSRRGQAREWIGNGEGALRFWLMQFCIT